MAFEFKLPDIGEGLVEGEIVKWLVKTGDQVREDQPLVEVMTDKATVEITSPRAGTIAKLLAAEGETVKVHSTIVVIEESGAKSPVATATKKSNAPVVTEQSTPVARPSGTLAPRADNATMILPPIPSHRVLVAPAVRRLAMQQGIDLHAIHGSGPHGRVRRDDVEKFMQQTTQPQAQPALAGGSYITRGGPTEEIPLRGLRKRIAAQMLRSKQHVPHFTYVEEVDMTDLMELRQQLKGEMQKRQVNLTYLPFIFKAIVPVLKEFPQVNASLDDARGMLIHKKYYNFGISVATADGLMVPVVKDVDQKDIWQIASEIQQLSQACRDKKVAAASLQDATFTVTSIGSIGGVMATPVINYPEVAIMGVFKIRPTPVVQGGQVVVRQMMYLATSFDHRVVDGDVAAYFTNAVVANLQNPKQYI